MSEAALRQSLAAALQAPRDERLSAAIWLYLHLLTVCNHRGLVCRRLEKLAEEVSASEEQVQSWLGALHGTKLICPETPAPFLVIRIASWPGEGANTASPYGYRFTQSSESKSNSDSGNSHRQPVDPDLMREVLDTLGESDPASFQGALEHYAPATIRKALDKVRAAGNIRTSRTALFRYLLPKLSKHE